MIKLSVRHAPLAQLDRASGYGPEGQEFESLTACQKPRQRKLTRFLFLHVKKKAVTGIRSLLKKCYGNSAGACVGTDDAANGRNRKFKSAILPEVGAVCDIFLQQAVRQAAVGQTEGE